MMRRHPRSFGATVLLGLLLVAGLVGSRPAQGQEGVRGTIDGIVRDERGNPVVGAEVSLEGQARRIASGADGRFLLLDVPLGRQSVRARRPGFSPDVREVQVGATGATLELRLRRLPQVMPTVTVQARKDPSDARLAGFRARAANPAASAGHIFTRARIEASANRSVLDLVRTVPGVRIQAGNPRSGGPTQTLRFRSNRCPPVIFIDGFASSAGEFDLESINLQMVEGVEVYASSTSTPPEFFANSRGQEQCGVVAIWSRPAESARQRVSGRDSTAGVRVREQALCPSAVDLVAVLVGGIPEIVPPDSLSAEGREGVTVLEFVVDARGRPVPGTVRLLASPDPRIGRALQEAVLTTRWIPAEREGRRVAQLVVQPVRFGPGGSFGVSSDSIPPGAAGGACAGLVPPSEL